MRGIGNRIIKKREIFNHKVTRRNTKDYAERCFRRFAEKGFLPESSEDHGEVGVFTIPHEQNCDTPEVFYCISV